MHLSDISKLIFSTTHSQTTVEKPVNKYQLYNLLFNGQISMKEFLSAIQSSGDSAKRDE